MVGLIGEVLESKSREGVCEEGEGAEGQGKAAGRGWY